MSVKPIIKNTYSTPRSASLYAAPPYLYQDNRSISIIFKTTPETLSELVPAPLLPNPDALVFIYIAEFKMVAPQLFNYMEMGIGVPASFSDTAGQFAVYLYLDKAGAIVAGREIYGWPKKDAEISFTEDNEIISAQVVRGGVKLVDTKMHQLQQIDPIPKQSTDRWFNLKLIPAVKKNALPDVMQLTSTLVESETKELYTGSATLKFGSSISDPLGDIPIVKILKSSYTIDDTTLGYGDVIYDYLTESK
jgi:acetoacetate decarboxylase